MEISGGADLGGHFRARLQRIGMAALRRKFHSQKINRTGSVEKNPSKDDSKPVQSGGQVTVQKTSVSYSDIAENVLWVLERGKQKGNREGGEEDRGFGYNQLMGDEVYEQLHVVADKNGDGFVNERELAAFVEDVYSFVDLNEDGMVDDYELNNFVQVRLAYLG